jgi:hypothetical protein
MPSARPRLAPLLRLLRHHGVSSYSEGSISIVLGPAPAPTPTPDKPETDKPRPPKPDAMALAASLLDEAE